MADEILKKFLVMQEASSRRFTDILETVRRQTEPLASALQAISKNSAMNPLITEINRKQEIIRAALGPMEELRRFGCFEFEW